MKICIGLMDLQSDVGSCKCHYCIHDLPAKLPWRYFMDTREVNLVTVSLSSHRQLVKDYKGDQMLDCTL